MVSADRPVVTILGAGLAGPLLATYLGRAGYPVHLYEMRADPRVAGASGGRSINLALSERGLHALSGVGLRERVLELSIPMRGRMMHGLGGELTFQPYGTEPHQFLNSVSRARLNALLLDAAGACPDVRTIFEQKVVEVDLDQRAVELVNPRTEETHRMTAEILVGADGAYSRLRAAMTHRESFDHRQEYLEYGYKELTLPPRRDGGFALERNALHIWPRRTYMMIALPNTDATFTCTLFWPYEGEESFAAVRSEAEIQAMFRRVFPDAVPLMPDLVREFQTNPVGSLVTVRCHPWHVGGRAVLVGDAAHAVVPFYGQGMNASFEDCTVLAECLERHAPDRSRAFAEYEARRKVHTDALAELAVENFVEMRDKVGSRAFLARKQGERALHRLFPRWYVPLYTMVTFTRMPYADARRRAARQDRIVVAVLGAFVLAVIWVLLRVVLR